MRLSPLTCQPRLYVVSQNRQRHAPILQHMIVDLAAVQLLPQPHLARKPLGIERPALPESRGEQVAGNRVSLFTLLRDRDLQVMSGNGLVEGGPFQGSFRLGRLDAGIDAPTGRALAIWSS